MASESLATLRVVIASELLLLPNNGPMETASERRKRRLQELCDVHTSVGVAARAGVSAQTIKQILAGTLLPARKDGVRAPKGLGNKMAAAIEDAYDLGRGWFDRPEPERPSAVAHQLSLDGATVLPKLMDWRGLMDENQLEDRFRLPALDDAMSPLLKRGAEGIFSRTATLEAGKTILIADRENNFYIRAYKVRSPGLWQAVALHDGFDALESVRDGLRIIAVLVGVIWE